MVLQLTEAVDGHQLLSCATTCWPFGLTMYTAPEKGALFWSVCAFGSASGIAIGSATHKAMQDSSDRARGARSRIS